MIKLPSQKNAVMRFLIFSFIGLVLFSILSFSLLGFYMTQKSHDTFHEISSIYMSGIGAQYPMADGSLSNGLVAAVSLDYLINLLSLDKSDQMLSFSIIRDNGTFVVKNPTVPFGDQSDRLPELLAPYHSNADVKYSAKDFSDALMNNQSYMSTVTIGEAEQKLYSHPLSYSEWNLVSFMPYNQLSSLMGDLNTQRTKYTVLSCTCVLIFMMVIFWRYFKMSEKQILALKESRMEAAKASHAKSEFLANMSHDIRTPMNAIVGMTAIATAHIDDQDQVKNCLRKIALSSKQLLGLINDVLDMSKIESGKMTLTKEIVSLVEIFEGVVSIIQPQLRSKSQNFDVHIDHVTTESVWCDGVRLNQVLLNLLSNATKYTQENGNICLSLSEETSPKGDSYARVHIKVKDNGIGMTPEFLERIFESYSRMDVGRVQKTGGTGLGMAITKYIVDAMEGTIQIESEENKGTEFHLTFDFEKADTIETNMVFPAWNMLVVDDDEFLCQTTMDMLKSFGIHAEWTLSGESAIEMALQHHQKRDDYQIILLDWKLPGMNGIQVARKLREHLGQNIPILLISAYDWSDFEEEARKAGINGFICKPLFRSTLFYNLKKYMGEEKEISPAEEQKAHLSGHRILLAEDNELN